MTTQTTNNSALNIFRTFFGRALVLALLLGVMTIAASAQTNKLYYQQGGAYFGTVTVYSTHFEFYTNNTVIKTYSNSCKSVANNGLYCTFGQWKDGRIIYSGDALIYQNGVVYLRWLYEFIGNQQRNINGGWVGLRP